MSKTPYNPILHRVAWAVAVATFPLIFMGGLVTSKGVGLAVPDWPNSFGYNMFLLPWSIWGVYGIFYEHTHRILGTVVGYGAILLLMQAWGPAARASVRRGLGIAAAGLGGLSIGLCGVLVAGHRAGIAGMGLDSWLGHAFVVNAGIALILLAAWTGRRREPRPWVCWLAVGVLAAVIAQGVLGGLRVVLMGLNLAVVHAVFAQAFFCLAALMCVVTSRWWMEELRVASCESRASRATRNSQLATRNCVLAGTVLVGLILLQLIAGALMRHHEAGLAIPDLPLAYGRVLPPMTAGEMEAVNQQRLWQMQPPLPMVSLTQVWMHFAHRVGAVVVTLAAIVLLAMLWKRHRDEPALFGLSLLLAGLLAGQWVLGVLTVLNRKPADIATLHVATGALVLVTAFVITVRAIRLYARVLHTPEADSNRRERRGRREMTKGDLVPALPAPSAVHPLGES